MAEREVLVYEAEAEDASGLLNLIKRVETETDFLTSNDDKSLMTERALAQFIQDRQLSDNQICLLARIGQEIVGVLNVSAESSSQVSHIGEVFLAVSKDYWGYGLGQMLMEAALDWAEHSNTIRRLELTVQKRNKRAIHIYQKFGFEIEGLKKRGVKTKDGEFLDVCLMGKLID